MTMRRTVVLEGIVLTMVILVAVALFLQGGNTDPRGGSDLAGASPTRGAPATAIAGSSSATAPGSAVAVASPSPSTGTPSAPAASPSVTATSTRTPRPTPAPRTSADPHLAYADFLRRVNDDRSKVDELNRSLSAAVTAGDRSAGRAAAVAILDFVDGERLWLLDHPPADCYAVAHGAGVAMLEAYQTAASLFVDWSATSGLAGLVALGKAADAATVAADALTAFGDELGRTRCPA